MLTSRRMVVVGGDARMLEVIRCAHDDGAHVTLLGFDDAPSLPTRVVQAESASEAFQSANVIVLPMSGIDDDGRVETRFAAQPVWLHERDLGLLQPGTFVFTGIARARFETVCHRLDLRLVKLMDLDDVAILNSIPTAEGTIAMAMEAMDITIHGSRAIVVGFGRCGVTLARDLDALGADVTVVARRPSDLARVAEMGLVPLSLQDLTRAVGDADLVVNTVPYPVIDGNVLDAMKPSCVVLDIASKPGGTDFDHAAKRGIRARLAPSLPGLVAPKTAGRIVAGVIDRILRDACGT